MEELVFGLDLEGILSIELGDGSVIEIDLSEDIDNIIEEDDN